MDIEPMYREYLKLIGKKIKAKRKLLREKIHTVAVAAGVSDKVISQIEHGIYECAKFTLIKKICDHLKIPMKDLTDEDKQ